MLLRRELLLLRWLNVPRLLRFDLQLRAVKPLQGLQLRLRDFLLPSRRVLLELQLRLLFLLCLLRLQTPKLSLRLTLRKLRFRLRSRLLRLRWPSLSLRQQRFPIVQRLAKARVRVLKQAITRRETTRGHCRHLQTEYKQHGIEARTQTCDMKRPETPFDITRTTPANKRIRHTQSEKSFDCGVQTKTAIRRDRHEASKNSAACRALITLARSGENVRKRSSRLSHWSRPENSRARLASASESSEESHCLRRAVSVCA